MSRISRALSSARDEGRAALIAYVMAGFPDAESTVRIVRGLVRGGADIIELGFPFSDPLADGPTIQDAATESLRGGASMGQFLSTVRRIREETDTPLVLMTYSNVLYRRGYAKFASEARRAGIDGLILPDMSIEESEEYLGSIGDGIDAIFLISPNTDPARVRRIAAKSSGFLYLVAVYGTTGTKGPVKSQTLRHIRSVKASLGGSIPVGVGFGVSTPQDVGEYAAAGADAVIVGSAYIRKIRDAPPGQLQKAVESFTRRLRSGTRIKGSGRPHAQRRP